MADADGESPSVDCEAVRFDGFPTLIRHNRPRTLKDGIAAAICDGIDAAACDLLRDGRPALVADERRGRSDLHDLDLLINRLGIVRVRVLAEARLPQVNRASRGRPGVAVGDGKSCQGRPAESHGHGVKGDAVAEHD